MATQTLAEEGSEAPEVTRPIRILVRSTASPAPWVSRVLDELTVAEGAVGVEILSVHADEPVDVVLLLDAEPGDDREQAPLGVWRFQLAAAGVETVEWRLVADRGEQRHVLRAAAGRRDLAARGDLQEAGARWPVEVARSLQAAPWGVVARPERARRNLETPTKPGRLARLLSHLRTHHVVDRENWQVGLRPGRLAELLRPGLGQMQWLKAPDGHYYADPFLVESGSRLFLFVEDWDRGRRLGTIHCAEVVDGSPLTFRPVLEEPHHLSYPFVKRVDGAFYMLPEQEAAGGVHLYEATDFPWRWRRGPRILDGHFVDPTLWIDDSGCWLWVARGGPLGADELHLFHAPRVDGPYRAHPGNPVVVATGLVRPAGPMFRLGPRLVRPAQDCTSGYGSALILYEIVELTTSTYRERLLRRLIPAESWADVDGMHHVSSGGGLVAIDANRFTRRRVGVGEVLAAKLSAMRRPSPSR